MIKELVETTLEAEIGSHLQSIKTNRRNGYNKKSNKRAHLVNLLDASQDRNGETLSLR